jgi:hypothetical protein
MAPQVVVAGHLGVPPVRAQSAGASRSEDDSASLRRVEAIGLAARRADAATLKKLLSESASDRSTLISSAAKAGDVDMLGALLEAQPSEAQEARLASLRLTRAVDDATRDAAAAEPANGIWPRSI